MSYWDLVVNEVINRYSPNASFCFTHRGDGCSGGGGNSNGPAKRIRKRPSTKKKYPLGPQHPGIFFSEQEAACMNLALKGKTIPGIGEALQLSPRTVEFYLMKMRHRLKCATKSALIEMVAASDFLKNYEAG